MSALADNDPMPFGNHKGVPMEEVPASYLLWLWDNGVWQEPNKPIHRYIKDSFSALETECKDYIVQHPQK
jgi:uncharacterized protein (DUF3820 family)